MVESLDEPVCIQERQFPAMACFGCGPANPRGLRLRSFVEGGAVVAEFLPRPEHDNGLGFLNGGIICTVLDCHSAAAAVIHAQERGWSHEPGVGYVTAGIDVRFLRPTPLGEPLSLRARVVGAELAQIDVEAELIWDGKVRAQAASQWKRSRARPQVLPHSDATRTASQ